MKGNPNDELKTAGLRRRVIALTVRGLTEPETYFVSGDVYRIVRKMLALNQFVGPYGNVELIDFAELRFLLRLLGAPVADPRPLLDLWVGEE